MDRQERRRVVERERYRRNTEREYEEALKRGNYNKPIYILEDKKRGKVEGFACEHCGRRGPYHHFDWAHTETRASNPSLYAISYLRKFSARVFDVQMQKVRFLCKLCHADETEEQRNDNWGKRTREVEADVGDGEGVDIGEVGDDS